MGSPLLGTIYNQSHSSAIVGVIDLFAHSTFSCSFVASLQEVSLLQDSALLTLTVNVENPEAHSVILSIQFFFNEK